MSLAPSNRAFPVKASSGGFAGGGPRAFFFRRPLAPQGTAPEPASARAGLAGTCRFAGGSAGSRRSEDGVCRTALASVSGQVHECRQHTNENAWKFLSQFVNEDK